MPEPDRDSGRVRMPGPDPGQVRGQMPEPEVRGPQPWGSNPGWIIEPGGPFHPWRRGSLGGHG